MTPYADFGYFLFMAVLSVPAVLLGLKEKSIKPYLLLATVIAVYHTCSLSPRHFRILIAYFILQWLVLWLYRRFRESDRREILYYCCLLLSLLPLIAVKIIPFLDEFRCFHLTNIGFLGISYLTFRNVQLIIESHDKLIKGLSFLDYTSFLLFFPTLSSGPIDRSRRFFTDLFTIPSSREYLEMLHTGIRKIFLGLLYKYILGHIVNVYWLLPLQNQPKTFINTWNYMYAYSAYLFFDFAGYSLFAIGFSYIFRIRTPENFNYPFISRNIKDFWNRWHMSLSFWFRDFVFMRVMIWLTRRKVFTGKYAPVITSYFALFGLMGLWHGVTWHYIAYGLYHATLMVAYEIFSRVRGKRPLIADAALNRVCSVVITAHAVCFGFLIFSGRLF